MCLSVITSCSALSLVSAVVHRPPPGPWRCWAEFFGHRRSWADDGTTQVVAGDMLLWTPSPFGRIDERCCANPDDRQCWGAAFSHQRCCSEPRVLPRRCSGQHNAAARGADLESPCASLDELGQWFAVTPPPPRVGGADKHSHRHDFYNRYETLLARFGESAHLLEIGVAWGNSLAVWSTWFPKGFVLGVDLQLRDLRSNWDALLALGANSSGNAFTTTGDATTPRILSRAIARSGRPFDIVVDDSSHTVKDQIRLFEALFAAAVAPGGVYIVEDAWGGGALTAYFAELAREHIWLPGIGTSGNDGARAKQQRIASVDWRSHMVGVSFFRHLIVIEKLQPG